ncbi:major facilitator superfamily domain-containing protein [Penicillium cinerascens]|uniref:Major facilitator superfamily domain-containing protein n=1 Tax=Penicillium cinerascens TaxID=70096 RepID=A0A9W9NAN8_9EURO|nr:major facilitator superfamily domain-containing protein [Penicillium cinerascens]KAJ5216390.1 major facilitator superfamily domain-containing protein [Penicillium cinerascens]
MNGIWKTYKTWHNKYGPMVCLKYGERFGQIDYIGALLSIGTLLCSIMAMNFGGVLWNWSSSNSIGLFVGAGVLLILFLVQQTFKLGTSFENRMFPMHFWKSRTLIVLFFTMMLATFGSFIGIYYLPIYYQFTRGSTAIQTSVHLLPFIRFLVAFNMINGHFMGKTGYYYPWYIFGAALELIAVSSSVSPPSHTLSIYHETHPNEPRYKTDTVDEHTSDAKIYGYTIIMGTGVGCFCQAGFAIAQMKVKPEEIPFCVGFMTVGQMMGIVFGTGISGALFVNFAQQALQQVFPLTSEDEISNAISGVGSQLLRSASSEDYAAAIHGITRAIQLAYVPIIAAGAICLVCGLLMKREKVFVTGSFAG